MPKFRVYAVISGGKYLGEVEAENEAAAIDAGWEHENCYVSICHQCSREIDGPEVTKIEVEPIEEAPSE